MTRILALLLFLLVGNAEGADVRNASGVATSVVGGSVSGVISDKGGQVFNVTQNYGGSATGLVCDGVTDNTALWNALVASLPTSGGILLFPPSIDCVFASAPSAISAKFGIRIIGSQGRASNDTIRTRITFTAATGTLFEINASKDTEIAHLNIVYSNAAYAGTLIKVTNGAIHTNIHDNKIGGLSGVSSAAQLILVDSALDTTIARNFFHNAAIGIQGGTLANIVHIRDNYFQTNGFSDVNIYAQGQAWDITGNTAEPARNYPSDPVGAFIKIIPGDVAGFTGVSLAGLTIGYNWLGDALTGTWIDLTGGPVKGLHIHGGLFQHSTAVSTGGVQVNLGSAVGVIITGNFMNTDSAANNIVGGSATNTISLGNHINSGITFNGTPSGRSLWDDGSRFRMSAPLMTATLIGGTATTSSLTYQTTTGVGTTGADHVWKTGNNGATEPLRLTNAGLLKVGPGMTSAPAVPGSQTIQGLSGAIFEQQGGGTSVIGRRTNTSFGSPSAVLNSNTIFSLVAQGYRATGYSGDQSTARFVATQTWTDSANGVQFQVLTTPNGSTTQALALVVDQDKALISSGKIRTNTTVATVGGSCGSGPTITGTDVAGKVITGTGAPTSCTVTFSSAWASAPSCWANNETTANLTRATSTTTTVVLAGTMVAGDVLTYGCIGGS